MRDQRSFFCKKPAFGTLRGGMKFKVKYAINNPRSAVMILDEEQMYIMPEVPCDSQSGPRLWHK